MIFKPVGGASSKGIFKISEASTLTAAFDLMRRTALPQNDKMFDFYTGQYLAEEFMVGSEFSVEGVAQNGQIQIAGVTEKWTTSDNFTERQHLFPARIGLQLEQQIRSVTESALKAIEFKVGAFHVELMSTSSGPKIVEINGRLGGDYITTHLVQLGRGIEIIGEAIKAAAGDPIDLAKHFEKAACVRFKIATQEGNVVSWSGLEEALATPGVIEIIIDRDVGSAVRLPPKKYGEFRLSAAIAQADTQASALEATEIAEKILQVELTPFPDSFESSEERI
jgi:biotin carboxylase